MAPIGVSIQLVDQGGLVPQSLKGVFTVQVITKRGIPQQEYSIKTPDDFVYEFGLPEHQSALEAYKALSFGVQLQAYPVAHYTDINDTATIEGTVATAQYSDVGPPPVVIDWAAKTVGDGYNGIVIDVSEALSGNTANVDITITVPEVDRPFVKRDVPKAITVGQIAALNVELPFVNLVAAASGLEAHNVTLALGAKNITLIDDTDIIGVSTNNTGTFAFNAVDRSVFRIMNLIAHNHAVDNAYVDFAEKTDRSAHLPLPSSLSPSDVIDYRNGNGTFTGVSVITKHQGRYFAGDVLTSNPIDPGSIIQMSAAPFVMKAIADKDTDQNEWRSIGQEEFNLTGINGLLVDYSNFVDEFQNNGVNPIINQGGVIRYFGNRSTEINPVKLLFSENVSDIALVVIRRIRVIAEQYLFRPNTFSDVRNPMYLEVKSFMRELESLSAIVEGENIGWLWTGDQQIKNNTELIYNANSAPNEYRVQLQIIPIFATESIPITIVLTLTINQVTT